jgi:hypothetical protein
MPKPPRYLLLSIGLSAAVAGRAVSGYGTAEVMPEAKKFLATAHTNLSAGDWDGAAANAGVVLISDEVSVNVNFDRVPVAQREGCSEALDEALSTWESALDGTTRFRMEADPAKADVRVKYQPDVRLKNDAVAGLTTWKRFVRSSGGKITGVSPKTDVLVRTTDLQHLPMPMQAMRQATEHELGHVFGLEDSPRIGDIMGQFDITHPVQGPKDYEIQAVKALREDARKVKLAADAKHQSKPDAG